MSDVETTRRVLWLTRLLGAGGLALMAVTWKLWTPQDVFPRVPLFWWAPPHWLDWTALAVTVFGLVALIVLSDRRERFVAAAMTACGFALLFLSDQHRLQPWAWQFFILSIVLALADDRTVFHGWRWLVVSIYFWSAWSKFDMAFAELVSEHFAWRMFDLRTFYAWTTDAWTSRDWIALWISSTSPGPEVVKFLAFGLPLGELATAMALCRSGTRRYGLWCSLLMHALLLAALGPFGLNHKPGVLLWNMYFITQNLVLFQFLDQQASAVSWSWTTSGLWSRLAAGCLAFVMIWPASVPWGGCDPWLGWAVYVPPSEEARMVILRSEAARLPRSVDEHLSYSWCGNNPRVTITESRWSLDALGVPVYPHPRFQIGVYLDFYERYSLRDGLSEDEFGWPRFFVDLQRRSGRFWPSYQSESIETYDGLVQAARRYRFNAFPESYYRKREALRGP